jgi:hypothetical protein
MTHSIHEHLWVYLADLALTVSGRETDVELRRGEYCIGCSAFRVLYPSGWYVIEGEATKEFMTKFDKESSTVLNHSPPEFKIKSPTKQQRRLGRGLVELRQQPKMSILPGGKRGN